MLVKSVFMSVILAAVALLGRSEAEAGEMFIVEGGRARAAVVTAESPRPAAEYASKELVEHIRRATGVTLPVVTEGEDTENYATRIFVGETQAAREQGILAEELGPDVFVLRTVNGDVYVLGREKEDTDPLHPHSLSYNV